MESATLWVNVCSAQFRGSATCNCIHHESCADWERTAWKKINVTFIIHFASCCSYSHTGDTGIRNSPLQHCKLCCQRGHEGMVATPEWRDWCVCYLSILLRGSCWGALILFFCKAEWVERAGNEKSMKKFAIWFGTHPLHFDTTINDSWRCFMGFSYNGGRFVHRGLKETCEGSRSSQHKEHCSQPLNMLGAAQAHHRRNCSIVVPAFLGYWLVWWCLNHLSRTCKA